MNRRFFLLWKTIARLPVVGVAWVAFTTVRPGPRAVLAAGTHRCSVVQFLRDMGAQVVIGWLGNVLDRLERWGLRHLDCSS